MRPSWGYRVREHAGCVVLLLLLPALALAPSLFQGAAPIAPDSILALPPWESAAPAGTAPASDPLSAWQLTTAWPAYQYISENRAQPAALWWNPDTGLGQPFLADVRNRCLSFFTIPFYLFDLPLAWALSLWLKLAVAGWAAYYGARRYGFTAGFALIVALVYQWSGPVFHWVAEPMGDILPWFPLLLLAVDRLLIGQFRAWPKAAIAVALMALGGDVRLVAGLIGALLLYMALRRARDSHHVHLGAALPGFALGVAAGLGLATPQLIPYFALLREGATAPGAYPWPMDAGVLLGVFGTRFHETATGAANPLAALLYVGHIPLLLAGVWCSLRRFVDKALRHRVECLGLAALLIAAVPLLTGDRLGSLPLLRLLHPACYLAALALPFALMTAALAETWLHLNADQCKRVLARMALILPLYWGGLLSVCAIFVRDDMFLDWRLLYLFVFVIICIVTIFAVTLLKPNPRIMAAGMAALLMILIALVRAPELPRTDASLVYPETPLVQSLQAVDARVGGTMGLAAWPLHGNRIPALQARSTVSLNRTERFLAEIEADPLLQRRAGVGALLLRREDIQGPYALVRPELNIVEVFDAGVVLFRDLSSAPPYRMAYVTRPSDAPDLGPMTADGAPRVEGFAMPPREGPFDNEIEVLDRPGPHQVRLRVETNQPGLLIVTTAWYPEWRAWVGGKETLVYPVDGALQGVEVVAGEHTVELRYDPRGFRIGVYVCIGFALLLAFGVFRAFRANPGHG